MAAAPKKITRENFTEWTKQCGVRNIQSKFDEMLAAAKGKGIPVDQEMKERGFRNYQAFARTCDQFALCCWPEDFAELGSGFVLYFYFLLFLVLTLVVVFALQVPAMATYSGEDWLSGWAWHRWEDGMPWKHNVDFCDCLGTNVKETKDGDDEKEDDEKEIAGGPAEFAFRKNVLDYGQQCKAWDLEYCKFKYGSDLPKWCCASWCFAKEECQAPPVSDKSKQNVHYLDLVRAASPCQTDPSIMQLCSGKDEVFKESGVETSDTDLFISKGWLTPGNFGPDQADNKLIPLLYLAIVAFLAFIITLMSQHQIWMDAKVDRGITSPNDFAILVKGLPSTATDEGDIMKFFTENAVKGKNDTEIVKVVIGFDIEEFREKIAEIKELKKQIDLLEPGDPEAVDKKKKMVELNRVLGSAAPDKASQLRSSGVVVVVFRYQADLRACLDRWTSFWAWKTYSDYKPCCCPGIYLKGTKLKRYPIGDRYVNKISVERAPNPGDIHWEELGMNRRETVILFVKTNLTMFFLVLVTAVATWGLNKAEDTAADKGKTGGAGYKVLEFLPAIAVALVNLAVMLVARMLGDKEYHETWTSQEFSQAVKMALALVVNTGGVLLWSNLKPSEWYRKGGLIDDAFLVILLDALVPPIILGFDLKYYLNRWRRNRLTQAKLDSWNETLASCMGTPEQEKKTREVEAQVNAFKAFFEPSEIDNPRRYANALNTFIVCLWFSPVLPFACLIGIVGLFFQYCMDKYLLLRWYRRPKRPYNSFLARLSLRMIKTVGPLGFSVFFLFWLSPSWESRREIVAPWTICMIISVSLILIPSHVLRTLLGFRLFCGAGDGYKSSKADDDTEDYYSAQHLWSKEMKYHKDHFLYRCLPEAKNPEFLSKDTSSVTKLDDVKSSYGTAVEASAAGGGGYGTALKGGHVVGGGDASFKLTSVVPAPAGATDSKSSYGAGSAYGAGAAYGAGSAYGAAPSSPRPAVVGAPDPVVEEAAAEPAAPTPVAPTPVAPAPVAPTPAPAAAVAPTPHPPAPKPSKPVWEFSNNHGGFDAFFDDCQEFIEKKFQDFQSGRGDARVNVRTRGKTISVDFKRMSQMVEGSHKVREIRRTLK